MAIIDTIEIKYLETLCLAAGVWQVAHFLPFHFKNRLSLDYMSVPQKYGRMEFPKVSVLPPSCPCWYPGLVIQTFIFSSLKHCHLLFPDGSVFCLSKTLFQTIWKRYLFLINHHIFLKNTLQRWEKNRSCLRRTAREGTTFYYALDLQDFDHVAIQNIQIPQKLPILQ